MIQIFRQINPLYGLIIVSIPIPMSFRAANSQQTETYDQKMKQRSNLVFTVIQKCNFNRSLEKVNVTIFIVMLKEAKNGRNLDYNNNDINILQTNERTNVLICRAN